jgi:hypothetical protein
MDYLKIFLRNLGILVLIGVVLWILFPSWMTEVYKLYGAIFGPIALLILVVAALPKRKPAHKKEQ